MVVKYGVPTLASVAFEEVGQVVHGLLIASTRYTKATNFILVAYFMLRST